MGKRPQISDDLHDYVHKIHEESEGTSAGNFDEALRTVAQLAELHIMERDQPDPGWYPGKYLSEIVGALSDIGKQNTADQGSTRIDQSTALPRTESTHPSPKQFDIDVDNQVVCKVRLDEDGRVTIPETERQALGLTSGEILQLLAYPVESESGTVEETATDSQ